MLLPEPDALGAAILARSDVARLEQSAAPGRGMVSRWQHAARAVEDGETSAAEVRRVFGVSERPGDPG